MAGPSFHILLVEDDDIDAEFILRGFRHRQDQQTITVARNGLEALELLRGALGQARPMQPHLIITDINMPQMNGLEFIQELRRDPALRQLMVFVLTGSALAVDKQAAYDSQVAGYILKGDLPTKWPMLLQLLDTYLEAVEFPPDTYLG